MVYSNLQNALNNQFSDSKFPAELATSGGCIQFSNTSGKVFSLGLASILSIFKDILQHIDIFSEHTEYDEKTWRDLGSKYFTDGAANALSTVQTKALFSTLSKIINWANNIQDEHSDSQIHITKETLLKTIEEITNIIEEFTPREHKNDLNKNQCIIQRKEANIFAKDVLIYLNNYDGLKKLLPYLKEPNNHNNLTVEYEDKKLTSIFKASDTKLGDDELKSGGYFRNFSEPISINGINEYVYISNQWTGIENSSRLWIKDFMEIINSIYSEFSCIYIEENYCFKKKDSSIEEQNTFQINTDRKGSLKFQYKNILLKGVPGTGKSHFIDKIITEKDKLNLEKNDHNILRINIHSASSNADLMQGIGISTSNEKIIYKEKQGLILNHIKKSISSPQQPFVIVLEEIQENSLNELIGDLIYLIEDTKRTDLSLETANVFDNIESFIDNYVNNNPKTYYVEIPYLVSTKTQYKKMILPKNLYIFCTSNYRDDKKVIEDNLLRRFEVIEIYPAYKETIGEDFKSKAVSDFLKTLNELIVVHFHENGEIHPDRFMIGHAIWLEVIDKQSFYAALLKVVTEFKDIKELEYDTNLKIILSNINNYPFGITKDELDKNNYKELVEYLQEKCYNSLFSSTETTLEENSDQMVNELNTDDR